MGAIFRARGWTLDRFGLRFSWKAAAAGIPLFVFYLLLSWITATLVLLVWPAARDIQPFRLTPAAPFWLLVAFIVIHAVFEEVTVTAFAITALSRKGAAIAIGASVLFRVVFHLHQGPLAAISIIPLGFLFGALFWRARNAWPLIVAHAIANVIAFATNPQHPG